MNTKNGTCVSFKPDATIFETVEFDFKRIASLLKEFAYLCTESLPHKTVHNPALQQSLYCNVPAGMSG